MTNIKMQNDYSVVAERPAQMWINSTWLEDRLDAEFYQPQYVRAIQSVYSTGFPTKPLIKLSIKSFRVWWGIKGLDKPISSTHIPYIRPNEVDENGWIEYKTLTTIERHWADDLSSGVVQAGDLLVEVKGNARKVHVVREDVPPLTFASGSMYRFVPQSDTDFHYVSAYLTSNTCQTLKDRLMSNSIIEWINPQDICQLPVPVPPRPVQEYIGAKVRLAERCRLQARKLQKDIETLLGQLYYGAPINDFSMQHSFWVGYGELDNPRVDAWHYQPVYRHVVQWCREQNFIPVSSIASLSQKRWSPEQATVSTFHYVEISDVDVSTGLVSSKDISTIDAPSRARKLAQSYNVIVSTVRPERKGIGFITPDTDGWVLSTGFSVLKVKTANLAYFLCAILRHDVSTIQLIRWNTGATYPAIEEDVPLSVLIPNPGPELQNKVADNFRKSILLLKSATKLVQEAKTDVEALIEGKLDVEGILAGRVKAPTWEALNFSAA